MLSMQMHAFPVEHVQLPVQWVLFLKNNSDLPIGEEWLSLGQHPGSKYQRKNGGSIGGTSAECVLIFFTQRQRVRKLAGNDTNCIFEGTER